MVWDIPTFNWHKPIRDSLKTHTLASFLSLSLSSLPSSLLLLINFSLLHTLCIPKHTDTNQCWIDLTHTNTHTACTTNGDLCLLLNAIYNNTAPSPPLCYVSFCSLSIIHRCNEQTCPWVLAEYTHKYMCLLRCSFHKSLSFFFLFVLCNVLHCKLTIFVCLISLIYMRFLLKLNMSYFHYSAYVSVSVSVCVSVWGCMCVYEKKV